MLGLSDWHLHFLNAMAVRVAHLVVATVSLAVHSSCASKGFSHVNSLGLCLGLDHHHGLLGLLLLGLHHHDGVGGRTRRLWLLHGHHNCHAVASLLAT